MTKAEMFDWLDSNNATIYRQPMSKWTREDGSEFYSNFTLCSGQTQWPAFPTLSEAVQYAAMFGESND